MFCIDKRGIAYMVLNQQLTREQSKDFWEKVIELRKNWLPFVTNYCELKEKGWYKKYDEKNDYVSEKIEDMEAPYTKQYHHAWSTCPFKKELIELIKSCEYLDTIPALETLKLVTGIETEAKRTVDDIL